MIRCSRQGCRGKCVKTGAQLYLSWLLKQLRQCMCFLPVFPPTTPSFLSAYRCINLYRCLDCLCSHPPVIFAFYCRTFRQFRVHGEPREWEYLTQRETFLCIRKPWRTCLCPPRTVFQPGMNPVTSWQCQGEGNMSVPPWRAFPRSVSLRIMTVLVSFTSARPSWEVMVRERGAYRL